MAEVQKPVVYILRGDDRVAVESHLKSFFESLGDANIADMNTTHLDGPSANLNDLRNAALALPFLAERRLVILEDALKLFSSNESRDKLLELFDIIPETTGFVMVVVDTMKLRKRGGDWETYWQILNDKHWLIKWAHEAGNRAVIVDCALPNEREMREWIRNKAAEVGGHFTNSAVELLFDYVGNNTQHAALEIDKLLAYVNYARPVDFEDVKRVSIQEREADIFHLVDAIGSRDGQSALDSFHLLLEEMDFIYIFGMIIRQFRLLIQAREIVDTGGTVQDVAKLLNQRHFIARKLVAQAQKFSLSGLEDIYQQLLKIDVDAKTGGMPGDLALDVFIARLARTTA